jgi:hypothetical protein
MVLDADRQKAARSARALVERSSLHPGQQRQLCSDPTSNRVRERGQQAFCTCIIAGKFINLPIEILVREQLFKNWIYAK